MLVVGKWSEIEPGDADGRATMAEFFGGKVEHLPLRDPLTLAPPPSEAVRCGARPRSSPARVLASDGTGRQCAGWGRPGSSRPPGLRGRGGAGGVGGVGGPGGHPERPAARAGGRAAGAAAGAVSRSAPPRAGAGDSRRLVRSGRRPGGAPGASGGASAIAIWAAISF